VVVNSSSVGSVVNISERALALLALFLVRHSQMFEFVMVSIKKQTKKRTVATCGAILFAVQNGRDFCRNEKCFRCKFSQAFSLFRISYNFVIT